MKQKKKKKKKNCNGELGANPHYQTKWSRRRRRRRRREENNNTTTATTTTTTTTDNDQVAAAFFGVVFSAHGNWRKKPPTTPQLARIYHTHTGYFNLLTCFVFCLVVCVCFSNSWELNKCYRSFGRLQPTRMCQDFDWGGGEGCCSRLKINGGWWWSFAALLDQQQKREKDYGTFFWHDVQIHLPDSFVGRQGIILWLDSL